MTNFYLTSLEPNMAQTNYSQSIGGYISTSTLYPSTTLNGTVGMYNTLLVLNTPAGGWSSWIGKEYIGINGEMIQVAPIVNGSITVIQRGINNIFNMHVAGDKVYLISYKNIFNDVFDSNRKQYRCIAIRNDSISDLYDFSVYVKQNSRNSGSSIKVSIEKPTSGYLYGTSTNRTATTLVDASLAGLYDDNHFAEAYLKVVGDSVGRIVQSFDSDTGTFVLYDSFSSFNDIDVDYEVFPSPATRSQTGIISPSLTNNLISFVDSSESSPLYLGNPHGTDADSNLLSRDLFYLWIERTVVKGNEAFDANDFVIVMNYTAVS
jgi:hypothetical protein